MRRRFVRCPHQTRLASIVFGLLVLEETDLPESKPVQERRMRAGHSPGTHRRTSSLREAPPVAPQRSDAAED